jgi:small subunit ribosomal protein S20
MTCSETVGGEVMPNIKSAIKRVKITEKRRAQNAAQKSALRTAVKNVEVAVQNSEVETANNALQQATKKLDKAVTKGLVHKNAAARKKSRLAKKLNALSAANNA